MSNANQVTEVNTRVSGLTTGGGAVDCGRYAMAIALHALLVAGELDDAAVAQLLKAHEKASGERLDAETLKEKSAGMKSQRDVEDFFGPMVDPLLPVRPDEDRRLDSAHIAYAFSRLGIARPVEIGAPWENEDRFMQVNHFLAGAAAAQMGKTPVQFYNSGNHWTVRLPQRLMQSNAVSYKVGKTVEAKPSVSEDSHVQYRGLRTSKQYRTEMLMNLVLDMASEIRIADNTFNKVKLLCDHLYGVANGPAMQIDQQQKVLQHILKNGFPAAATPFANQASTQQCGMQAGLLEPGNLPPAIDAQ